MGQRRLQTRISSDRAMERCCAEMPAGETSLDPIARDHRHVSQETERDMALSAARRECSCREGASRVLSMTRGGAAW
jgi:hypothetical protein